MHAIDVGVEVAEPNHFSFIICHFQLSFQIIRSYMSHLK